MPSYAITGTSRGIGLAYVRTLGADPLNTVFALVRSKAAAPNLQEFVNSHPHKNVHIIESDNDDIKSIKAAAAEVSKITGGTLDVLINNGALMVHERAFLTLDAFPSEEVLEEDLIRFFKTNVLGPIHTINAFTPLLLAGPTKKCINITSGLGSPKYTLLMNYSNIAGYGISKAGLNLATAKYAARFKPEGLIFVAISPGFVKTLQWSKEEAEKFYDTTVEKIRKVDPQFEGAITPEVSVRDTLAYISKITIADSGAFVERNGTVIE